MRLSLWASCAVSLAGCGYSVGGLVEHERVSLPMFDSLSERREHEFALHAAVSKELKTRGVSIDPAAPVEMRGKILEITEPSVVEGQGDETIVGAVSFRFELIVASRGTGREISRRILEESATFSSGRSESPDTARQKVIDSLARRVVELLEKDF